MDLDQLIGNNWSAIRQAAQESLRQPHPNMFEQALAMYSHPAWEVRSYALALLGGLAAADPRALAFLFERCGDDPAWQANEALAMAFDSYCSAVGYEQALPVIQQWLQAPQAQLRRAVSEGLRPWTARRRAVFASSPQLAIDLLGTLKDDPIRYVQESAGNALRDISRTDFWPGAVSFARMASRAAAVAVTPHNRQVCAGEGRARRSFAARAIRLK